MRYTKLKKKTSLKTDSVVTPQYVLYCQYINQQHIRLTNYVN